MFEDFAEMKPRKELLVEGTEEQEEIWDYSQGKKHMLIRARAGTGKTFTGIQYCLRQPVDKQIIFLSFSRSIVRELKEKTESAGLGNVRTGTYHSLALSLFPRRPTIDENGYKVFDLMDEFYGRNLYSQPEKDRHRRVKTAVRRVLGLVKQYAVVPDNDEKIIESAESIMDKHGMLIESDIEGEVLDKLPRVLKESANWTERVDFDDMIYLPVIYEWNNRRPPQELLVDEAQDTNLTQQKLIDMLCPDGRRLIIGDEKQAIYGFRGADTEALENLKNGLENTARGVREFGLTLTRRCPKSHVRLVNSIVPDFHALPEAPEGMIEGMEGSKATGSMQPGDMVLCRVNAPLVRQAYSLYKRGVRAKVQGVDVGKDILELCTMIKRRLASDGVQVDVGSVMEGLGNWEGKQVEKYRKVERGGERKIQQAGDRADCLRVFLEQNDTIAQVEKAITNTFVDGDGTKDAVRLGSVHKMKGLEAERVFVLHPELMPHPMAKGGGDWEMEQEMNIAYVAGTRSKGMLVFVDGGVPAVFDREKMAEMRARAGEKEVAPRKGRKRNVKK